MILRVNSRQRVVNLGSKESRLNPRLLTPLKYYVFENIMENGAFLYMPSAKGPEHTDIITE